MHTFMRTLPIRFVVLVLLSLVLVIGCGQPAPITPGTTVNTYKGHSRIVVNVAWSPDGKYLASGDDEQNIQVWEAMTGKRIQFINVGHDYDYGGMTFAWSPNGNYLAAGFADRTVKIMDVMTGEIRLTYRGHTDSVNQLSWSPDGKYIASASNDKTIQVWDAATGRLLLTNKGYPNPMGNAIWSPDSKYIASGDDKTIQVWDAATGKLRLTYRGHTEVGATPLAWSPDGKYIASASWDLTLQVWDAMTGNRIHTFQGASNAVAWSPDGKYLALGSIIQQGRPPEEDHNVHVLDASTWSIRLTYTGHSDRAGALAWSPDGKYLASGSGDKTVQVWKAL